MSRFQLAFLIVAAVGLLIALIRWARTPENDPENGPRGDMARLLALVALAIVGDAIRSRFFLRSVGFWISSVLLVFVVVLILLLVRRLMTAYRGTGTKPQR